MTWLAVKAFLGRIPRGAWIGLAVIAILLLGTCAHKRSVKKFGDERYAAGVKAEGDRITAKALEIKRKADLASAKISTALKDRNDEDNRAIARGADDLRLLGPGKAACPRGARVPSPSSQPVAPGRGSDASPAGVPVEDWIALPFPYAVKQAETCDLNRGEVLTWREWYRQQSEAWAKIGQ